MSDDPPPVELLPERPSADQYPYGMDTIVIPFTWSKPRRQGPDPLNRLGQRNDAWERQLAWALKDARLTSTELALSALKTLRKDFLRFHRRDVGTAAADGPNMQNSVQLARSVAGSTAGNAATSPVPPATPNANTGLSQAGQDALYYREVQNGVSSHTHWPKGRSGVTLGPGYDLRARTPQSIENDLIAVGVDPTAARTLAQGAGLHDREAEEFARTHRNDVTLTEQQQRALFARVLPDYERAVRESVRVPLNQNQYDAMVSYAYNNGIAAFRDSDVLRLLNSNQLAAVPGELNRANSPLLAGRRAAEANQFQGLPFSPPPYR